MKNLSQHFEEFNALRRDSDRKLLCHAPFVSLNFDQSGKATACCYNRNHILGNYPENTIEEMWTSSKVQELREAIRNLDLSKGCQLCENQLISQNYRSVLIKNFDRLEINGDEAAALGPQILEFELSNLCNLECIMCEGYFSSSIRKNREKLPPLKNPYDDKFVEQLKPYLKHVKWTRFLGGEPFLNPLYYKIWEEIAKVNPNSQVVITSNASVMNQKVRWVLENVKPLMVLSIDSMKKKTYEKIRVNSSYERMMENLGIFMGSAIFNHRTVDLAVCPMTLNWEELPEMFDWGTEKTVQVNLNTLTRPAELSLKFLEKSKLKDIVRYYRRVKLKTWKDFSKNASEWTKTVSQNNNNIFNDHVNQIEFWSQS